MKEIKIVVTEAEYKRLARKAKKYKSVGEYLLEMEWIYWDLAK